MLNCISNWQTFHWSITSVGTWWVEPKIKVTSRYTCDTSFNLWKSSLIWGLTQHFSHPDAPACIMRYPEPGYLKKLANCSIFQVSDQHGTRQLQYRFHVDFIGYWILQHILQWGKVFSRLPEVHCNNSSMTNCWNSILCVHKMGVIFLYFTLKIIN